MEVEVWKNGHLEAFDQNSTNWKRDNGLTKELFKTWLQITAQLWSSASDNYYVQL